MTMKYSQASRDRTSMLIALALVFALGINFADADLVTDTDGQPLKSGSEYRISPLTGGGVGRRMRNHTCPLYVYYAKIGSPVVFTPFSPDPFIRESADLKVEMAASSTCVPSTRWRITTDSDTNKRFVYAGEPAETSPRDLAYFRIDKSSTEDEAANVYEIVYCPSVCETCRPYCGRVTTYSDGQGTGFLVIEPDSSNRFRVQFTKV